MNSADPFGLRALDLSELGGSLFGDGKLIDLPSMPKLSWKSFEEKVEKLKEMVDGMTIDMCKAECRAFIAWDKKVGGGWITKLPSCPCKKADATAPKWKEYPSDRKTHAGCSTCFRSRPDREQVWPPVTVQVGQQCCYDEKGNLITSGPGAGTADRRNPGINLGGHLYWDVYPYLVCKRAKMLEEYVGIRPNDPGKDERGKPCPKNPTKVADRR